MTIISIIIFIFCLFALSRVILRSRDNSISFRESLFWVILWTIIIIITAFPQSTDKISKILGVGRGVDASFFIAIITLFYVVFKLYIKIDSLDKNITKLNTEVTKKIHKLNKK